MIENTVPGLLMLKKYGTSQKLIALVYSYSLRMTEVIVEIDKKKCKRIREKGHPGKRKDEKNRKRL